MIQNKEIWKDILNYEGIYQVSNFGRVKTLKRKGRLNDKIMNPNLNGAGYLKVSLSRNCKQESKTIHQLVAVAFLNHIPNGHTMVVNHIDLDKTNNELSNLEIVTHRENSNHLHIKSESKYVGVSRHKPNNKWRARIFVDNKKVSLGCYDTEIEAHNAYQKALKNLPL